MGFLLFELLLAQAATRTDGVAALATFSNRKELFTARHRRMV